jgi:isopenicillin-N N-acyltransferase-like protein
MRQMSALLSGLTVLLAAPTALHAGDKPFHYPEGKHGQGELRYVNGVPVLSVAGTPEEIGEQVAVLGVKPASRLLSFPRDFLKAATDGPLVNVLGKQLNGMGLGMERRQLEDMRSFVRGAGLLTLTIMGNRLFHQFLPHHAAEVESIIRASGEDRDAIILANTMFEIKKLAACSTLIIEPGRSASGRALFGRNLDFPTLGYLQDYSLVEVYRPANKYAFATVGFPGLAGCLSGMNDKGLSVAILEVYSTRDGSPKYDPKGRPNFFTFRQVLEECSTVEEAVKLLQATPRATLANLAICDRNGGVVVEMTTRHLIVRKPEEGICLCTNHFRSQELATSTVCDRYEKLAQTQQLAKVSLADLAASLNAVNQRDFTMQTMVFEPAALKLHLAIGPTPTSALPMKEIDLAPLFRGEWPAAQK